MPTYASVTDQLCSCGYLERAANDPKSPIVFDKLTHEYQFVYPDPQADIIPRGKATLIIYHCPFCGGAAPPSQRDLLFSIITPDEEQRPRELLADVRTIDDALRILGQPDLDLDAGVTRRQHETSGTGPSIESFRSLTYSGLSKTVDVQITDYQPRVPDSPFREVHRPAGSQRVSGHVGKCVACR
jgi:hypothetical protein